MFRYREDCPWFMLCPLAGFIAVATFLFGLVCVGSQKTEEEFRITDFIHKNKNFKARLSRGSPFLVNRFQCTPVQSLSRIDDKLFFFKEGKRMS